MRCAGRTERAAETSVAATRGSATFYFCVEVARNKSVESCFKEESPAKTHCSSRHLAAVDSVHHRTNCSAKSRIKQNSVTRPSEEGFPPITEEVESGRKRKSPVKPSLCFWHLVQVVGVRYRPNRSRKHNVKWNILIRRTSEEISSRSTCT